MADVVEIILALRNVRQFVAGADKASGSVEGIGKAADKTGKQAKVGWKGMAKWAAPAAAFAGVTTFLKSSVGATEDLAKSTMTLQRATGLDAKTASEWASVTKARGLNTKQFQVGLVKLSKTMEAARGGNQKAAATLAQYGVSADQIAQGDISGAIMNLSDSFALMKNPAEKAALAQSLFGKSGQTLVPLLSAGSAGIQEQLGMAEKYGAVLDDKAVGGAKNLIAQQREMSIAMQGVKVQMGTALLPAIVAVVGAFAALVRIVQPFLRDATLMKIVLAAITLAFVAYKVAIIASTIATLAFDSALLLIPLAVIAIVAGVVALYMKWKWFHDAVNNTWQWIRDHWPLLAAILGGPFVAATILIVTNIGKIKAAMVGLWSTVRTTFSNIVNAARRVFSGGGDFVSAIGRGIADWLNTHTPFGDEIKAGPIHFRLPALAGGGMIVRGGAALVGEQGPELVTLPTGAGVYPTPAIDAAAAAAAHPGGAQTIITQVYLDKRQIAEAVGSAVSDRKARR